MNTRIPIVICLFLVSVMPMAQAQERITLTLALPEYIADQITDHDLDQFQTYHANVNIEVVRVSNEARLISPDALLYDPELYYERAETYASSADVVFVSSQTFSLHTTRAGYWLNLAPAAAVDPAFDESDFYQGAWEHFRWDNGLWALPLTIQPVLLTYDTQDFDNAGLAYPTDQWTIDDFANAARILSERDSAGEVTRAGFLSQIYGGMLLRSLLGTPLVASETLQLDDPALADLLEIWWQLEDEGAITITSRDGYPTDRFPISLDSVSSLETREDGSARQGVLLSGGVAGMMATGFAVSAGTQYPELAYELAEFLTRSTAMVGAAGNTMPARRSILYPRSTYFSTETLVLIENAADHALSGEELRFVDYLNLAISYNRSDDGISALEHLQSIEATLLSTLPDQTQQTTLAVATPVPTAVLIEGEIALRFTLAGYTMEPYASQWERLVAEFVEAEPNIGEVIITTTNDTSRVTEQADCFYLNYDGVDAWRIEELLPLDPLLAADASFDETAIVPGALEALQFNNITWAYPLTVQPGVLQYGTSGFDEAGIPLPDESWTINEFLDALVALKTTYPHAVPFSPDVSEITDLLILIAGFGGLPLDVRSAIPIVDFTSPENADAIRQVLDLVRDGYIDYAALGPRDRMGYASGGIISSIIMSAGNYHLFSADHSTGFVGYPQGSTYNAMTLGDTGALYISASAQDAEGCYRWISTIAQHPELFPTMPARISHINGSIIAAAHGEEAVDFYNTIVAELSDPDTLIFLSSMNTSGFDYNIFVLYRFLGQAFDAYVLEDTDLETVLTEAEVKADAYLTCMDGRTSDNFLSTQLSTEAYFTAINECLALVDPELVFGR